MGDGWATSRFVKCIQSDKVLIEEDGEEGRAEEERFRRSFEAEKLKIETDLLAGPRLFPSFLPPSLSLLSLIFYFRDSSSSTLDKISLVVRHFRHVYRRFARLSLIKKIVWSSSVSICRKCKRNSKMVAIYD